MADEAYWIYQASTPTPSHWEAVELGCFKGTEAGWHSLTPGMRREIVRSAKRKQDAAQKALVLEAFDDFEHQDRRSFLDRRSEVERAARQRL